MQGWSRKALALYHLGRLGEAAASYRHAISLGPLIKSDKDGLALAEAALAMTQLPAQKSASASLLSLQSDHLRQNVHQPALDSNGSSSSADPVQQSTQNDLKPNDAVGPKVLEQPGVQSPLNWRTAINPGEAEQELDAGSSQRYQEPCGCPSKEEATASKLDAEASADGVMAAGEEEALPALNACALAADCSEADSQLPVPEADAALIATIAAEASLDAKPTSAALTDHSQITPWQLRPMRPSHPKQSSQHQQVLSAAADATAFRTTRNKHDNQAGSRQQGSASQASPESNVQSLAGWIPQPQSMMQTAKGACEAALDDRLQYSLAAIVNPERMHAGPDAALQALMLGGKSASSRAASLQEVCFDPRLVPEVQKSAAGHCRDGMMPVDTHISHWSGHGAASSTSSERMPSGIASSGRACQHKAGAPMQAHHDRSPHQPDADARGSSSAMPHLQGSVTNGTRFHRHNVRKYVQQLEQQKVRLEQELTLLMSELQEAQKLLSEGDASNAATQHSPSNQDVSPDGICFASSGSASSTDGSAFLTGHREVDGCSEIGADRQRLTEAGRGTGKAASAQCAEDLLIPKVDGTGHMSYATLSRPTQEEPSSACQNRTYQHNGPPTESAVHVEPCSNVDAIAMASKIQRDNGSDAGFGIRDGDASSISDCDSEAARVLGPSKAAVKTVSRVTNVGSSPVARHASNPGQMLKAELDSISQTCCRIQDENNKGPCNRLLEEVQSLRTSGCQSTCNPGTHHRNSGGHPANEVHEASSSSSSSSSRQVSNAANAKPTSNGGLDVCGHSIRLNRMNPSAPAAEANGVMIAAEGDVISVHGCYIARAESETGGEANVCAEASLHDNKNGPSAPNPDSYHAAAHAHCQGATCCFWASPSFLESQERLLHCASFSSWRSLQRADFFRMWLSFCCNEKPCQQC